MQIVKQQNSAFRYIDIDYILSHRIIVGNLNVTNTEAETRAKRQENPA